MRRLLFSIVVLVLLLGVSLPVGASPVTGPPLDWTAHPPIHVRPFASNSPTGYSPAQIRHAYGIDSSSVNNYDGTGQTIAIIDAYDDPTVETDLSVFSTQYGLPQMNAGGPTFTKVYAQGSQPRTDAGWALEISLDVQWAHAIAPGADILLVEAASSRFSDLLGAVDTAVSRGADVVSMSWGGSEFSSESSYDYHFNQPGVVFTASSGDSGSGVIYPAASPYVLAVGGTSLPLDSNGNLTGTETAWSGSGGGISAYETLPGYQTSYSIANSGRSVPDVSYVADPNTGVSVYDSTKYMGQSGWWEVGGTSAGAPQWGALVAVINEARGNSGPLSTSDLASSPFYAAATGTDYANDYRDIVSGSNGAYDAGTGYDLVTGVGSPVASGLEAYLDNYNAPAPAQALSLSISTDKGSYRSGQIATITFTVTSGGNAVSGASVSGTVTGPTSSPSFTTGLTNSSGVVTYQFDTTGLSRGTYTVTATATYGTYTPASGSDSFRVH